MKCLLIFFICLGLTSAQYADWYKDACRAGTFLSNIPRFQCGIIKDTQNRIVDGTEAERNSIPWIAQVVIDRPNRTPYVYGGAIIGPYHILTVASMLSDHSVDQITVNVNKLYRNQGIVEDGEVRHKVKCLSKYPGFEQYRVQKDYALLILKEPIVSKLATPVCLPAKESNGNYHTFEDREMTVSGWGYTVAQQDNFYHSSVLKRAQVKGYSQQNCQEEVSYWNLPSYEQVRVDDFMICTKPIDGKACNSDWGGPLTFDNGTNHVLVGLASFNLCSKSKEPAVYSRVPFAPVIEWIERNGLYTGRPVCSK